jgi:hypothetical protein
MNEGMSRRDLIKASAAAAGVAWTTPMLIDSMSSPAAAQTGPGILSTGINCSKALVFFTIPGSTTVYIAGFQDIPGCQTCDCFGNWSDQNLGAVGQQPCQHACFSCGGTIFRVNVGTTNAGTTTACDGGTFTQASTLAAGLCDTYLQYGGGTVTGKNGAVILGAMGFGGDHLNGYCPSGNSITNLGACNTATGGNSAVTTSSTC